MKMSNEKKKETLLKNFEIIKDNYDKNSRSMGSAIVKMLKIDIGTAIDMWSYLLTKHVSKVKSEDSWAITGLIMYEGGEALGESQMAEIVLNNPVLKKAIFSYTCHHIHLVVDSVILERFRANDLQGADELFSLTFKNKYRNSSWYDMMERILEIAYKIEITEEAYELLEMWCDKVKDKEERANLSIKLLEYVD